MKIMSDTIDKKNIDIFVNDLKKFDIFLSDKQLGQFLSYYDLLIEWNSFMNLTAITDFSEVLKKHFIDSVSLIKAVPDLSIKDYEIIDVGTGAGLPGIPLKIVFPHLNIVLLDSLNKRVDFLQNVIKSLNLNNIDVIHGRAENIAHSDKYREKFDICVSRAVANMAVLSEYCIPFIKINGCFISYKSEKIIDEYNNAKKAIAILGGKYESQFDFTLPDTDIYRNLFIIRKIQISPLKYPRKAGTPSKNPLI